LAGTSCARAIGEIGLDYHYDLSPRDVQIQVFRAQVQLARELRQPVVNHTREADEDTLALLREEGGADVTGVLHCFTGGPALARAGLELGLYVSLAGIITFQRPRSCARPCARCPWTGCDRDRQPLSGAGPFRGKRNEPAHVARVAEALGALHGLSGDELGRRAAMNFHTLFRP
jgi:TatD DNase family protein